MVNFWTILTQFTILEFSKCLLWVHIKVKAWFLLIKMLWNKMWVRFFRITLNRCVLFSKMVLEGGGGSKMSTKLSSCFMNGPQKRTLRRAIFILSRLDAEWCYCSRFLPVNKWREPHEKSKICLDFMLEMFDLNHEPCAFRNGGKKILNSFESNITKYEVFIMWLVIINGTSTRKINFVEMKIVY